MKKISSDSELVKLNSAGVGLIYNDFSGRGTTGKKYNILHAASCSWVTKSNINVPKYFFSNIDEAVKWLRKNRGKEGKNWKRCGTCKAKTAIHSQVSRGTETVDEIGQFAAQSEVFTEGEVEQILIPYLKEAGYKIRRQVRVLSGIIDVVAEKETKKLLIEAKGEDRGGYGTTEMNFQLGLGQLMSRMKHHDAEYGLAFPVTKDFKKVLRKYKDSFAFEKLGIYLIPVKRDGACKIVSPDETLRFLKEIRG